ncbi:hypothetical protein [Clostridium homopropionicum]|nr:hypothetical protein [Clostridium homopropionicum]
MNKESVLITPEVIEECLCECLDVLEKNTSSLEKSTPHIAPSKNH